MPRERKWYSALCLCGNCKASHVEKFSFGQRAEVKDIVCKTCGVKGQMSVVGRPIKKEKVVK